MFHYAQQMEPNQREQLPGTVPNSAGGFSFQVDEWTRLDRLLILGTENGSYYSSARKLTRDSAASALQCITADGARVVARIVEVSTENRAPKNDPALFVLAMAAKLGDAKTRALALAALPKVARTGTHLFHFAEYAKSMGGWGSGTRKAFANWYRDRTDESLVHQAIKYQSRDGWSHRDLLRKSHPVPASKRQGDIFHWITQGWDGIGPAPHEDPVLARIWAFERAKKIGSDILPTDLNYGKAVREMCDLIQTYNLPHECVPNDMKSYPVIWEALLPTMGLGAIVRNLGKMTSVGLLSPLSKGAAFVRDKLADVDAIREARLHPLNLLVALKIYEQGHGTKSEERAKEGKDTLVWTPTRTICDGLDDSFYLAFKAVEPTGQRHMLALDVSASMRSPDIAGMPGISPAVGSAAMALVTANVEPCHAFVAFTSGPMGWRPPSISWVTISPKSRLTDVCRGVQALPAGGTDCALPMVFAKANKISVDVFVLYTDSETWHGDVHPSRALREYRQAMGLPAKLVVVSMIANEFSIADPNDAGMLDVVGFDTATPALISDFAR